MHMQISSPHCRNACLKARKRWSCGKRGARCPKHRPAFSGRGHSQHPVARSWWPPATPEAVSAEKVGATSQRFTQPKPTWELGSATATIPVRRWTQ